MEISTQGLAKEAGYKLLVGTIVPRPIAWITTLSENGSVNLAPFSFYTVLSQEPMMVGVNIGRRDGKLKDTARNIAERKEFVINVCVASMAEQVHLSGKNFEEGVSEVEMLGLGVSPSHRISTPRLAQSPICLECAWDRTLHFGKDEASLVVGVVKHVYVRDDLYREGKIDTAKLQPLARVAGPAYAKLTDFIYMK